MSENSSGSPQSIGDIIREAKAKAYDSNREAEHFGHSPATKRELSDLATLVARLSEKVGEIDGS